MKYSVLILLILSWSSLGHNGGLDRSGGHFDRKNGGYHCHREPCVGRHAASHRATAAAVERGVKLSYLYNRDDWKHWIDSDGDCMNTRHEILLEQADEPVRLSPDGCYVSMGGWIDPFSGKFFYRASELDVDHIVPLKWANDNGGGAWPATLKERFANDPINLLVVDRRLNQAKGAKGPSQWMPPNHLFRCEYLLLWVGVLDNYPDLIMSSIEKRVFEKQLTNCKG